MSSASIALRSQPCLTGTQDPALPSLAKCSWVRVTGRRRVSNCGESWCYAEVETLTGTAGWARVSNNCSAAAAAANQLRLQPAALPQLDTATCASSKLPLGLRTLACSPCPCRLPSPVVACRTAGKCSARECLSPIMLPAAACPAPPSHLVLPLSPPPPACLPLAAACPSCTVTTLPTSDSKLRLVNTTASLIAYKGACASVARAGTTLDATAIFTVDKQTCIKVTGRRRLSSCGEASTCYVEVFKPGSTTAKGWIRYSRCGNGGVTLRTLAESATCLTSGTG